MTMKIKKHIKAKRQYVSPSIYVKVLQMESMLAGPSATVNGGNGTSGDITTGGTGGDGGSTPPPGNPTYPPFGGQGAKANSRLFFDDETEE